MEKLSAEVLQQIFSMLNCHDIRSAAMICQRWRDVIKSSSVLMRKFWAQGCVNDLPLPYRNYIIIRCYKEDFFKNVDCSVVEKVKFLSEKSFRIVNFLASFQNLTTLMFESVDNIHNRYDIFKIDLPNLTHLETNQDALFVLLLIKTHKIQFLKFYFDSVLDVYNAANLRQFLKSLKDLKHLHIEGAFPEQFLDLKSQLVTLETMRFEFETRTSRSILKKFLELQKSSLKNLHLSCEKIDEEIFNFIYFEMSLEKVWDRVEERYNIKESKPIKVKSLGIKNWSGEIQFFEIFFRCCVYLEVLNIFLPEGEEVEYLRIISQIQALKFLILNGERFKTQRGFDHPKVTFENLQVLTLKNFLTNDSINVSTCCPNLEKLKLQSLIADPLNLDDYQRIFDACRNIKEISIYRSLNQEPENDFEVFKFVGSKVNFIVLNFQHGDVYRNKIYENVKNRTTVMFNDEKENTDLWPFKFDILTKFYYDHEVTRSDYLSDDDDYDEVYDDNDEFNYEMKNKYEVTRRPSLNYVDETGFETSGDEASRWD